MRKISFFAIALALVTFVWSCGPDGEGEIKVEISASNEYPAVGDSVTISVTATSTEVKLSAMSVEVQVPDSNGNIEKLVTETPSASDLTYSGDFTFVVPASVKSGAVISIIAKATDKNDFEESKQFKLNVSKYMAVWQTDKEIGHIFGPMRGAYDLVKGLPASIAEPANEKDLIDISEDNKELKGELKATPESGTKFVDLSKSYDIMSISSGNVANIWADRNNSSNVLVTDGTKFLVKLRGGNDYAVVHVTKVDFDWDEDNTGDDLGKYVFDVYKFK